MVLPETLFSQQLCVSFSKSYISDEGGLVLMGELFSNLPQQHWGGYRNEYDI